MFYAPQALAVSRGSEKAVHPVMALAAVAVAVEVVGDEDAKMARADLLILWIFFCFFFVLCWFWYVGPFLGLSWHDWALDDVLSRCCECKHLLHKTHKIMCRAAIKSDRFMTTLRVGS